MIKAKSMASFINRRLILVTVISALLASVLSALYTLVEFNFSIKPELLKKADAIVQVVHDDVELAIGAGVPIDQIRGMDDYLSDTLQKYPELTFIAVVSKNNSPLYTAGVLTDLTETKNLLDENKTVSYFQASFKDRLILIQQELIGLLPSVANDEGGDVYDMDILLDEKKVGGVFVGLNSSFIRTQLADIFFDIAIVLIAVLLVCFEVVMVVVMFYVSGPLEESESILKRQMDGNFSVKASVDAKGTIGHFVVKLNEDSKALQGKFSRVFSKIVGGNKVEKKAGDEVQTRLQMLAEKFHLQGRLSMRNGDILDARIPLFVFSFAEELQKSFMPLFVAEYYEPNQWVSRDVMLGLPISVFMLVIAVSTPFAAKWVDRWGQKPLFLIGLIPAIAGYLGCAFAENSTEIVISRGITALGYALITISCQSYIAAVVSSENRAKGMAIFVGVLMTATMCGTALGAIIADRIGYQPVFFISAVLATFAGFLAWRMFSGSVDVSEKKGGANNGGGSVILLAKNLKFVAIILCCAIPAKIVLTGFLYFMVPLYLVSLDASQSEIGRIMMIYSLTIIPLSPIASSIADKTKKMKELVVLGTVLSGAILISLYGEASFYKILLAVALMGIAHSILKAPLIASALEAAESTPEVGRTSVLGILRTSERIGSVLGPVVVASLLAYYDYGQTMAIVGFGILAAGLMMLIFLKRSEKELVGAEA
ncbi:MFS transporter [Marinomonas posidonica]|uniref:Major facilitator superfamily MFS_1 n=1 Tax=Marinomonas posidonica (strain CECT 7376 / NCIMB 14433 / IVIA-Po-181) TaxID=491952 RepID=F6D0Y0_MARPP|nr:MFS transporter [Marinomonas posidonica]AEF53703.1 major facilitator superfamily MFS_1 [Marinomonas posidonica IVIA-Po-181]